MNDYYNKQKSNICNFLSYIINKFNSLLENISWSDIR